MCGGAWGETAGFTPVQADRATSAVFTCVLGNAAGAAATAALTRRLAQADQAATAEQQLQDVMAKARDVAKNHPRLRVRLESPAAPGYASVPEDAFEFGLHPLLDGLERQLSAQP